MSEPDQTASYLLATNSQGQEHNFDSNFVKSCYTQNLVSGSYRLQGLPKFIITLHDYYP